MNPHLQYKLRDIGALVVVLLILFVGFMLFDWGLKAMAGVVGGGVLGIGLLARFIGWDFLHRFLTERAEEIDEQLFGERLEDPHEVDMDQFDADAAFENYMAKRMNGEVPPPPPTGGFGRKGL